MGLTYRRRVRLGKNTWLNVSSRGVSMSERVGRVTANTRGNVWVRLFGGLNWRGKL